MWNISNNGNTICPYCLKRSNHFEIVEEHISDKNTVKYHFLRCGNEGCKKFLSDVRDPERIIKEFERFK